MFINTAISPAEAEIRFGGCPVTVPSTFNFDPSFIENVQTCSLRLSNLNVNIWNTVSLVRNIKVNECKLYISQSESSVTSTVHRLVPTFKHIVSFAVFTESSCTWNVDGQLLLHGLYCFLFLSGSPSLVRPPKVDTRVSIEAWPHFKSIRLVLDVNAFQSSLCQVWKTFIPAFHLMLEGRREAQQEEKYLPT